MSDDDDRKFPPARELVCLIDRVTGDLDAMDRLIAAREGIPFSDMEGRRMRAVLDRLICDANELYDLATVAAHVQAKVDKGTN